VKDGGFQLVPYRALPRRAPFPSNLFQLQPARMFALWWPWLRLPGMEGSGEPG